MTERCDARSVGRFVVSASEEEPADGVVCDWKDVKVSCLAGISPKCLQKPALSTPNPFSIGHPTHHQFVHSRCVFVSLLDDFSCRASQVLSRSLAGIK